MSAGAVLDRTLVDALRRLGPEPGALLHDMVEAFLDEAPVALAEMAAAIDRRTPAAAAAPAHKLRGTSGHLGAARLAAACAAIETAALAADPVAPLDDLFEVIRREARLAIDAARQLQVDR
jgi:HPt (histidine-containing phosphotransfer) domain-containing protein